MRCPDIAAFVAAFECRLVAAVDVVRPCQELLSRTEDVEPAAPLERQHPPPLLKNFTAFADRTHRIPTP